MSLREIAFVLVAGVVTLLVVDYVYNKRWK